MFNMSHCEPSSSQVRKHQLEPPRRAARERPSVLGRYDFLPSRIIRLKVRVRIIAVASDVPLRILNIVLWTRNSLTTCRQEPEHSECARTGWIEALKHRRAGNNKAVHTAFVVHPPLQP